MQNDNYEVLDATFRHVLKVYFLTYYDDAIMVLWVIDFILSILSKTILLIVLRWYLLMAFLDVIELDFIHYDTYLWLDNYTDFDRLQINFEI